MIQGKAILDHEAKLTYLFFDRDIIGMVSSAWIAVFTRFLISDGVPVASSMLYCRGAFGKVWVVGGLSVATIGMSVGNMDGACLYGRMRLMLLS